MTVTLKDVEDRALWAIELRRSWDEMRRNSSSPRLIRA